MKLILISDCQLTLDKPQSRVDEDFKGVAKGKLEYVFEYAYKEDIEYILQAGDLLNIRRSWEMAAWLTSFLSRYRSDGVKLISILGQHDTYYHNTRESSTLFGVLRNARLLRMASDKPIELGESVSVYGASWGEEVPKMIQKGKEGANILLIHKPILMKKAWRGQREYEYAPLFLSKNKFDLILCGDVHMEFLHRGRDGRIICNTGPMLRLKANKQERNHSPCFFVYDIESRKIERHKIPALDGDAIFMEAEEEEQEEDFAGASDSFVEKVMAGNKGIDFEKVMKSYLEERNPGKGTRKILDETWLKLEEEK